MMRSLRIIIPAKNEASRIGATIADYCTYFSGRATVLVVANGCTDGTVAVVHGLQDRFLNLELMQIAAPVGKGGAIRAGMTSGSEPFVSFVDADGSAKAAQLDVLADICSRDGVSGAIGSRWLAGSTVSPKQPFKRRLASRTFNYLVRIMFGLRFSDTQCGAKVFRRSAIETILDRLEIANFAFDVDLLVALKHFDLQVEEVAIIWGDEADGSKVRIIGSGSAMVWSLVRLWLGRSPLRNVPFLDLIGRSSAIPVKRGLSIVVAARTADAPSLTRIVTEIRGQGHRVVVFPLRHPLDVLRFAVHYVDVGHQIYDVIVHDLSGVGERVASFSAKPKIRMGEDGSKLLAERLQLASEACGYRTVYWRGDEGWTLPTAVTSREVISVAKP